MRRPSFVLLALPLFCLAPAQLAAQPSVRAPLDDLAWLIGRWEFTDRATPEAGFRYEESGTRTCSWALERNYIRCESSGTNHDGVTRTYLWYINYNDIDRRFELVGLFPNWSRKLMLTLRTSDGGRRWDLQGEAPRDGGTERTWATMTRSGEREWVWETRRQLPSELPDAWVLRFRERARRVEP